MIGAYDTEADQIEALKRLWKEYGVPAIIGLIIGIAALYGWRFYQSYSVDQDKAAAKQYQEVWAAAETRTDYAAPLNLLRTKYSHSVYAILANLVVAGQLINDGKTTEAIGDLQWALDHSKKNLLQDIVRVRLARVYIDSDKAQDALKLLGKLNSDTYASVGDQTRGDAYIKLGKPVDARKAYESALMRADLPEENRRILQMKLADIAAAAGT